jgi:hypothetical protein
LWLGLAEGKDVTCMYLGGFHSFRGLAISTLFTPRRARIGSLHSGGAGRSQAAGPTGVQIPRLDFHRRLEMIIRPLTTAELLAPLAVP